MFRGFRDFILRGNVIDLAVAVVIGGAFAALVGTMGDAVITPVVNRILDLIGFTPQGGIDIGGGQQINVGAVVTAIIIFALTALVIYYVFVLPMNHFRKDADDSPSDEVVLLEEIRNLLRDGVPDEPGHEEPEPNAS